ncbi:hypothetical protein ACLOJK_033636 [Asimina triloba]
MAKRKKGEEREREEIPVQSPEKSGGSATLLSWGGEPTRNRQQIGGEAEGRQRCSRSIVRQEEKTCGYGSKMSMAGNESDVAGFTTLLTALNVLSAAALNVLSAAADVRGSCLQLFSLFKCNSCDGRWR